MSRIWRILSVILVTTLSSATNLIAQNFIESPEGSCSTEGAIHSIISCTTQEILTIESDGQVERIVLPIETPSAKETEKLFTIMDNGGLFSLNKITNTIECVGIDSPWSIKNSANHSFVGTDGFHYFSQNFRILQKSSSVVGGEVIVTIESCNAQ